MSNQDSNTKLTSPKLEVIELANLVPVHIPDDVRDKIKFLCKKIAKVEWSGVLFYEIEGDMMDGAANMKITLRDILLMDRGSAAYTSFDWDEDVVEYQMEHEEAINWTIGHIHSHNTMGVFFSGTDWSELNDNCPQHNFYLSVIVNNYTDIIAKIAFTGEQPNSVYTCKNKEGKDYKLKLTGLENTIKMLVYDCEIIMNHTDLIVPDEFANRIGYIEEKLAASSKKAEEVKNPVVNKGYEVLDLRNKSKERNGKIPFPDHEGREHEKSISDTLRDFEKEMEDDDFTTETMVSKFVTRLLRLGDIVEDDELEDVLEDIEESKMSMKAYKSSLLDMYPAIYDNFFDKMPAYHGDDPFLDVLEDSIELLKSHEASYQFLTGIISALENFAIKFEASVKQKV